VTVGVSSSSYSICVSLSLSLSLYPNYFSLSFFHGQQKKFKSDSVASLRAGRMGEWHFYSALPQGDRSASCFACFGSRWCPTVGTPPCSVQLATSTARSLANARHVLPASDWRPKGSASQCTTQAPFVMPQSSAPSDVATCPPEYTSFSRQKMHRE
jgi:hypothetical protein